MVQIQPTALYYLACRDSHGSGHLAAGQQWHCSPAAKSIVSWGALGHAHWIWCPVLVHRARWGWCWASSFNSWVGGWEGQHQPPRAQSWHGGEGTGGCGASPLRFNLVTRGVRGGSTGPLGPNLCLSGVERAVLGPQGLILACWAGRGWC